VGRLRQQETLKESMSLPKRVLWHPFISSEASSNAAASSIYEEHLTKYNISASLYITIKNSYKF